MKVVVMLQSRSRVKPLSKSSATPARVAGDSNTAKPAPPAKSNSKNKIPKSIRYDLETTLLGLCDVWFEEIKPHLVKNKIKVHIDSRCHCETEKPRQPSSSANHIRPCSHLNPAMSARDCKLCQLLFNAHSSIKSAVTQAASTGAALEPANNTRKVQQIWSWLPPPHGANVELPPRPRLPPISSETRSRPFAARPTPLRKNSPTEQTWRTYNVSPANVAPEINHGASVRYGDTSANKNKESHKNKENQATNKKNRQKPSGQPPTKPSGQPPTTQKPTNPVRKPPPQRIISKQEQIPKKVENNKSSRKQAKQTEESNIIFDKWFLKRCPSDFTTKTYVLRKLDNNKRPVWR